MADAVTVMHMRVIVFDDVSDEGDTVAMAPSLEASEKFAENKRVMTSIKS